jgi:Short C-terminal domain
MLIPQWSVDGKREIRPPSAGVAASAPTRAPAPAGDDVVEDLGKLADLHATGALSDAEFAAAKARLIGPA